jgi:hypothetical protein
MLVDIAIIYVTAFIQRMICFSAGKCALLRVLHAAPILLDSASASVYLARAL